MRAAVLLLLLTGCGRTPPGREFLETFPKDEAYWGRLSKGSQQFLAGIAQTRMELGRMEEDQKAALQRDAGISDDPMNREPGELARRIYLAEFLKPREYVGEAREGDAVVVRFREDGREREWVLVTEGGSLRLDVQASMKRENEKK